MLLMSWNVNGIRAVQKKGFIDWLQATQPDILALQETKAHPDQLDEALLKPLGYHTYWASAERKGYSGVAIYSKIEPKAVQVGLGFEKYDREGRTLIADYGDFVFLNAYFPNGGNENERVPYKMEYNEDFLAYCNQQVAAGKGVIFCGDVNTSHKPIDLSRPKQNEKISGFLPEERAWMDRVVEAGYYDSYRLFYPDKVGAYSWWSMRTGGRPKNVGWRLDYFFVSANLTERIVTADINNDVLGSDHCPVSLVLKD